ncbi:MAG: M14 family metallopeptidase [Christensenellales bacterium]|jgi:g-D-glutamyl-meso-diaminopimelate peptidase
MDILEFGSTGPDVELLQLALSRAGYDAGEIDGFFGMRTQAALISFQDHYALEPDGVAGGLSWRELTPYIVGYVTVLIQQGDTFYSLAGIYNTDVEAIQTANPTADAENLVVGAELIIPLGFSVVPTEVRYTSKLMELIVRGLVRRYPFIRSGSIGKSVMGRPLYALEIGAGETPVGYNASHHANEWITTPVVMKFLENYAFAYARGRNIFDTPARELYEQATLSVVPMVNPDGVDLVSGSIVPGETRFRQAQAMAAQYPNIPFPSGWKANINGVDLNLGYPAGWEMAREIKFAQGFTVPGPRDYVGEGPLSEPENRAMYEWTQQKDFALTLSYHTQGQVIFWRFENYMPENAHAIGQAFSAVSGYALEDTPPESSYAGYRDWFIQTFNRPGYTIEAGLGENPLPLSQFDEIYNDNEGILTLGIKLA